MTEIPVLFVEKNSIYYSLSNQCYDKKRNALTYKGTKAAIYHPPCRLFSRLWKFSSAPPAEKLLAYWAVNQVRAFGGVLEHPSGSSLWNDCQLPRNGGIDKYGGFSISVYQHWFGHPCEKKTWLYICGLLPGSLPDYPLCFDAIQFTVSGCKKPTGKKEISKTKRSSTPIEFAKWLINICEAIEINKAKVL